MTTTPKTMVAEPINNWRPLCIHVIPFAEARNGIEMIESSNMEKPKARQAMD